MRTRNETLSIVAVCVCYALTIFPFTFRNERGQCFADFLLTEFNDQLFKLERLTEEFCERLHRCDVRTENLESSQDRHG